ncbi:putative MYND domain protein [Diplocarpon rosae]|nr:putative MYND domain protein [Diplocarpon rosae]
MAELDLRTSAMEAADSSKASSSSQSPAKICTACSKPSSEDKPLKPCTKCQSVQYCSRDCQKADFKKHKKECAKAAQVYAQNADIKMAAPSRAPKDGFRGGLQKWQFDT